MKKTIISIFFLGSILLQVNQGVAQSVKIGLKGGFSLVNQRFKGNMINYIPEGKLRPHGGVFIDIDISSQISIQPEILFAGQGYGETAGGIFENIIKFGSVVKSSLRMK